MLSNAPQVPEPTTSPAILVSPRPLAFLNPRTWNGFARSVGGSLNGSYREILAWQVKRVFTHRVRILDIHLREAGRRTKIGQCAVGVPHLRGISMFLDGVQLAPEHDLSYPNVMTALLDVLGDGEYSYGWVLSLEPRRDTALQTISGVELQSVRPIEVHAVDFSRWDSWSSYFRNISENSKRSAKAALRDFGDLSIDIRSGLAAAPQAREAGRLNYVMAQRKGLSTSLRRSQARYAWRVIVGGSAYTIALVHAGGRVLSSFVGAQFGTLTYYLEGGSDDHNAGGSWHLILTMLKRAFERDPHGRFIMGHVDYSTHDEKTSGGLIRSRNACRVSRFETSVVRFRYRRPASSSAASSQTVDRVVERT